MFVFQEPETNCEIALGLWPGMDKNHDRSHK